MSKSGLKLDCLDQSRTKTRLNLDHKCTKTAKVCIKTKVNWTKSGLKLVKNNTKTGAKLD